MTNTIYNSSIPKRAVYIIGAGGYGRIALSQMLGDPHCNLVWYVAGFLDSRENILDGFNLDIGIQGNPLIYVPQHGDEFVCALGDPNERERYSSELILKNAKFMNILTEVSTARDVYFEPDSGVFIERGVRIGSNCKISKFVHIHSGSILGHDITVGDYSQISSMCFLGGGVKVGKKVRIFPHASIRPEVKIGDGATIGIGSVVIKDVEEGKTVFGNPAKVIF